MNEQALSVRDAIVTRRSIKNFNGQPVIRKILPKYLKMQHGHLIMVTVIHGVLLSQLIKDM